MPDSLTLPQRQAVYPNISAATATQSGPSKGVVTHQQCAAFLSCASPHAASQFFFKNAGTACRQINCGNGLVSVAKQ
jgi:hypothetical protein